MSSNFFTNHDGNSLIKKFEGVFGNNPQIKCLDVLVGFFRASGYFHLRPHLDNLQHIRVLVGINVDAILANAHQKARSLFLDKENAVKDYQQQLISDIAQGKYDSETEQGIKQFIDDIVSGKLIVKAHPSKKIHAKFYILRPNGFNEHTSASVIMGSSNLTDPGLGIGNGNGNHFNYEFNVLLNNYEDVKFALDEFESLWGEGVDILPADIEPAVKKTYLNDEISPYDIYIKTLIEYFGDGVNYDPDSMGELPTDFKKLSYQVDAVNEGYKMLIQHNGFMLCDVVGLGKTVVAAMIAQKFRLRNNPTDTKILVVYPPALEKSWRNTFKKFHLDQNTQFISNGSLNKIIDNVEDYWAKEEFDLIIVDEAHKFRNHTSDSFAKLQHICKSNRINQGMIEGNKKVILVTATPLNNKPEDIYYQLLLFQDANRATLPGVTSLESFFSPLSEKYKTIRLQKEPDIKELRQIYHGIREKIIKPVTIRRTRNDLDAHEEYKKDIAIQGIVFPKVLAPQKLEYLLDDDLAELFNETVVVISSELTYARYQAIANLIKKEHKDLYENAEKTAKNLARIVKIQLVKRLESSFYAFKKSLEKFQLSNARMIVMFENDKIYIVPDLDINKLLDKGLSDEEIYDEMADLEGDRNKVFTAADFEETFIEKLKADDKTLTNVVKKWQAVNEDPKLQTFLAALRNDLLDKAKNTEGKLVIFSESKDTVDYLAEALKNAGHQDILAINGQNRNANYDTIIANFDANLPIEQQKNDFNIILSTEVLAEGVNLHRANVVVNYDTPWNSTKLMQRIGRVNRIGSRSPCIYNFVFYPSAEGNAEIRLTQIALTKLQAFHSAYGEDNQVYSVSEILNPETLTTTAAIVEDKDERLEYLFELRRFLKNHPKEFVRIKNLPLKSRTGRNSQALNQPELSQSTISFIKDQRKINFYLVDKEKNIKELTEIEAFAIFKAKADESRTALIPMHHEQVQAALSRFADDIVRQEVANLPISQSVSSKSARTLLSNWSASTALDNIHREKISQLITLVEQGKYANLAKTINRFGSKTPSQQDIIKKIDEWTKMYYLDHSATSTNERQGRSEPQSLPNLILSESFG